MANIIFNGKRAILHKDESHIFRLYNGFGINNKDMKRIKDNICDEIMIVLKKKDGEEVYIVSVQNWDIKALSYDNKGEPQTILMRSMFDRCLR